MDIELRPLSHSTHPARHSKATYRSSHPAPNPASQRQAPKGKPTTRHTMTALKLHPEHQDDLRLFADLAGIPVHDPSRYETTDGLDNPSCTNGDRASLAAEALDGFQKACGMDEDVETAAADLICDLLHLLHANHRDPLRVLRSGIHAFLCEAGKIIATKP